MDPNTQLEAFDGAAVHWRNARSAVLALLMSGGWHDTVSIHAVGDTSATRRLRELRRDGQPIVKRQKRGSKLYEYSLEYRLEYRS